MDLDSNTSASSEKNSLQSEECYLESEQHEYQVNLQHNVYLVNGVVRNDENGRSETVPTRKSPSITAAPSGSLGCSCSPGSASYSRLASRVCGLLLFSV